MEKDLITKDMNCYHSNQEILSLMRKDLEEMLDTTKAPHERGTLLTNTEASTDGEG